MDDFVEYWNNHIVRYQNDKELPSGAAPNTVFSYPGNYSLEHCGVPVDREIVEGLRETMEGKTRTECFSWVTDEFAAEAELAYEQIGSPELHYIEGWRIFIDIYNVLTA